MHKVILFAIIVPVKLKIFCFTFGVFIMKKILLGLLAVSSVSAFAVSSTMSILGVSGVVPSTCSSTIGGTENGTMAFPALVTNSATDFLGTATYVLTCNAGASITSITTASGNATNPYNIASSPTSNIPYSLTATATGAPSAAYVGTISAISMSVLTGTAAFVPAFNFNVDADPLTLIFNATISKGAITGATLAGTYTDTVNIVTNY